jgi:hypothetical protein
MAYNVIFSMLDIRWNLTEEQENLSRIQLDAWLEWHREKHLPQYIVKLEQWEKNRKLIIERDDIKITFDLYVYFRNYENPNL